jgi:hypothetical protein
MKLSFLPFLASVLVLCLAGACKKGPPAPAQKHDEHAAHSDHADHADHAGHGDHHDHAAHMAELEAKPKAAEPVPAGPKIETGSFLLEVTPAQPSYAAGKPGELEIALESRGEWHVNEEYPIRVDLKAPAGVAIPKAELVKDDAKEFNEEKVRFLAAVEPSAAGEHEVTCDVSFALCTEENCILERRTLAMKLEVE